MFLYKTDNNATDQENKVMENKGYSILLVDDEQNILSSLKRLFRKEPYKVTLANSAEEGIKKLKEKEKFQLIISDYRMPGKTGVEFLKEAKDICPNSIRIILSGYADIGAILSAINEGEVYKFLTKPWDDDDLKITIRRALEQFELANENKYLAKELKELNRDLEAKVEKRTKELEFRNRALLQTQEIMEELPFAVIGIDNTEVLTLINKKGKELFTEGECVLGSNVTNCLPAEIIDIFNNKVPWNQTEITRQGIAGIEYDVHMVKLGCENNFRGYVLTFTGGAS